jgi:hypothetical protein
MSVKQQGKSRKQSSVMIGIEHVLSSANGSGTLQTIIGF